MIIHSNIASLQKMPVIPLDAERPFSMNIKRKQCMNTADSFTIPQEKEERYGNRQSISRPTMEDLKIQKSEHHHGTHCVQMVLTFILIRSVEGLSFSVHAGWSCCCLAQLADYLPDASGAAFICFFSCCSRRMSASDFTLVDLIRSLRGNPSGSRLSRSSCISEAIPTLLPLAA